MNRKGRSPWRIPAGLLATTLLWAVDGHPALATDVSDWPLMIPEDSQSLRSRVPTIRISDPQLYPLIPFPGPPGARRYSFAGWPEEQTVTAVTAFRIPHPQKAVSDQERLFEAVRTDDLRRIKELIRSPKVDLNAPENDHAHTRLIDVAALQGLPEVVRLLLQHGARVRPKPGQNDAVEIHPIGEAMLGLTAASQPPARYEATIRLLLEAGADPDDMAIPALHMSALGTLAVAAKSAEAVSIARLLVEHGATLDRTASFTSPLLLATKHDRDDLLGPLLTASRARCEPLTEALRLSESKHYYRISDQLVASGADPNIKGESHTPLLCEALQTVERPTSFALTLLVHHANPNVTCDEGPPLFLAIKDPNLVSALLEHGADPNRARADGATPLTVMVKADHQTTDLLLAHGARLGFVTKEADAYRKHGVTLDPVVWAILHHQDYLATRLIQRDGMDSIDSKAAVVYAASEGSILALTELLQHGADPNSSSVSGISALMAAAYHGQTATLEELLAQSGLQVNGTTPPHFTPAGILKFYSENRKPLLSGQRTALMYAAAGSNVEALKILIAHGARTNLQDAEGLRAVDYARIAAMRTALTELSTAH